MVYVPAGWLHATVNLQDVVVIPNRQQQHQHCQQQQHQHLTTAAAAAAAAAVSALSTAAAAADSPRNCVVPQGVAVDHPAEWQQSNPLLTK